MLSHWHVVHFPLWQLVWVSNFTLCLSAGYRKNKCKNKWGQEQMGSHVQMGSDSKWGQTRFECDNNIS
jgi:hypothetical protein